MLSAFLDPSDRAWAAVTVSGTQHTFMNDGDMYVMGAQFLEWVTGGAVSFSVKPPPPAWPRGQRVSLVSTREILEACRRLGYEETTHGLRLGQFGTVTQPEDDAGMFEVLFDEGVYMICDKNMVIKEDEDGKVDEA